MAKGLDCGTGNLVCASKDPKNEESEIHIKSVRDVFLDIEAEPGVLNMLKMSNISYIQDQEKGTVYILGDAALSISNLLKRELRRPLAKGLISPGELEAEKVILLLIKSILGSPSVEDEIVYYSVPARPIDAETDIVYHEAVFKKLIESLSFKAQSMNESSAIVFSNCSESGFTAIATSHGSGMCNTAIVYKTIVGMAFSNQKAGDWIDRNAALATGATSSKIMSIKEKGIDLLDPTKGDPKTLREREAIIIYYKNMIKNVIDGIKKEFKKNQSSFELPDSIPWVLSGGTSLPINFKTFFEQEFQKNKDDFPINVSDIIMAKSPLNDVANGLLIAAMND